jgi:hypothetical protein
MASRQRRGSSRLPRLLLTTSVLTALTSAQSLSQGNSTSLSDAFPELTNLTLQPATASHRKPTEGGQNFTHCCLLAVSQSLEIVNGYVIEKVPSFINATVDDLLAASAAGQFPCGAVWDGNPAGAPIVQVPDSWLESTCPGWQLSDTKKGDDSEFISPFVGFLLPAVVFCKSTHFQTLNHSLTLNRSHHSSTTKARSMAEIIRSRPLTTNFLDSSSFRHDGCWNLRHLRHNHLALDVLCVC